MKFSVKTLLIGFGLLAVVSGVLYPIERKLAASKAKLEANTRIGPRAGGQFDKPSPKEVQALLKEIIIASVNFEKVSLKQALEFLNTEIAKQIPKDQLIPKVKINPSFLIWTRERHEADSMDKELQEALGGIELEPYDRMQIEELRVRNIPADVLIQYICDATASWHYIYRGNVYVTGGCEACSLYGFYSDEVFSRIYLDQVRLDQLVTPMDAIIKAHEYRGPKGGIRILMSEQARTALLERRVDWLTVSLDLEGVTLNEVMGHMKIQSNGVLFPLPESHGVLVYDPLKEFEIFSASELNPFDRGFAESYEKLIPLDENWNKPQSTQKPSE